MDVARIYSEDAEPLMVIRGRDLKLYMPDTHPGHWSVCTSPDEMAQLDCTDEPEYERIFGRITQKGTKLLAEGTGGIVIVTHDEVPDEA